MRKGVNPEKLKNEVNHQYKHRVIMPVYIPNVHEEYYTHAVDVFKTSLKSLIDTVNLETTAITIINNNSIPEIDAIINAHENTIDKKVTYKENKGKVYAVLNEMRSCYEPFVTCTDADVLFMNGWEKAVFATFKAYPKAGVVAPLPSPSLALNHNSSIFLTKYLFGNISYKKIVADEDSSLYLDGLTNRSLLKRSEGKYDWNEKQYYLKGNTPAIVGAGHFVATYKSMLFDKKGAFPKMKFVRGYESDFMDALSDKYGLYRLSTPKTFVYHIGNNLDDNIEELTRREGARVVMSDFDGIKINNSKTVVPYGLKEIMFKVLHKIFKF